MYTFYGQRIDKLCFFKSTMKANKSLCQASITEVYQRHLVLMCPEFSNVASEKPLRLLPKATVIFKLTECRFSNHF